MLHIHNKKIALGAALCVLALTSSANATNLPFVEFETHRGFGYGAPGTDTYVNYKRGMMVTQCNTVPNAGAYTAAITRNSTYQIRYRADIGLTKQRNGQTLVHGISYNGVIKSANPLGRQEIINAIRNQVRVFLRNQQGTIIPEGFNCSVSLGGSSSPNSF